MPFRVRSLEELGAPRSCTTLLNKPYGIVLVVGPTGSGKSTTLAAMIDRINETKPVHILTIEDPVEYLHHHKMAMVNQREVGTDAMSFEQGLRSALREDPDVMLLGEMRDLESIQIALSLAETGHLVFATLHTNDASQALDRMVDVFPGDKRDQIQTMLAGSLQGVVSQRLLPAISGGRVAAYEVLMGTEAVRNLVREGKSRQLRNVVATGGPDGMQTIEMDFARLVSAGWSRWRWRSRCRRTRARSRPRSRRCVRRRRRRPRRPPARARRRARQQPARTAPPQTPSAPADPRNVGPRWQRSRSVQVDRGRHAVSRRLAGAAGRLAGVTVIAEEAFVLRKLMEVLDYRPKFDFAAVNIPFGLIRARVAVPPVRRRGARDGRLAARGRIIRSRHGGRCRRRPVRRRWSSSRG